MNETISGILYIGSGITPDITLSNLSGINNVFNSNHKNIDFQILGTGNSQIFFDASTGRLGIGTGLPDAVLHVVAPCAKDGLIIESVTNCPTGVTLLLIHNPQTTPQSGSYPAIINLAGRDTNYNEIPYAQVLSKILDPTTGSTSGQIIFTVDETGVNKSVFSATTHNIVLGANNNPSGFEYIIVGASSDIDGDSLVNIGSYNSGISNSGLIIGNKNYISGEKIYALVNLSSIRGNNSLSMGENILISGNSNIYFGKDTSITGLNNILIGSTNTGLVNYLVSLSQNASHSGNSGISLGSYITNNGHNNIYIGNNVNILGNTNSIVGSDAIIEGNSNLIYGNKDTAIGSSLICIGSNQNINTVSSGLFLGNNISAQNITRSIVIGLANVTNSGLQESILLGINNKLSSGVPNKILLIGQSNITKDIDGSLVLGNFNNASGTVTNNIIVGNTNNAPPVSNNNILIGVLNNQTGVYVDSIGSISGTPYRTSGTINNSIAVGIHNVMLSGNANISVGNKNTISGSINSVVGSYNKIYNAINTYSVGNSNLLIGEKLSAIGSQIAMVGAESVAMNTANKKMDVFGSGNIAIGFNQLVPSGIAIGTSNAINGVNNIVYGRNNTLGVSANSCIIPEPGSYVTIPTAGVTSKYIPGDQILVLLQNPPETGNTFVRTLLDVTENALDNTTTLSLTAPILYGSGNGFFVTNTAFDDDKVASTSVSGLVMPFRKLGGEGGPETNPMYGFGNIVVGSNNRYIYTSGIVIGYNNNISGINNIAIGYGLSGTTDYTMHLGTNNRNKMILNDDHVVINSGGYQESVIVRSSLDNKTIINAQLLSNRVGINTNDPSSDLAVSGLLTADTFRLGLSAPNTYVLTTDSDGYGTWQLPVKITGDNSTLLYKVNDKLASGVNDIIYTPSTKQLNFNFGGNNGFYITSSGLYINDEASSYGVRIRGSGGVDFAPVLFNTNLARNRIDFFNISGNSGIMNNFNISSGVILPTNLTGTFLYVNRSGNLVNYVSRPHSVIFANDSSWATGNTSIRWINPQQTLALGATGNVQYDLLTANSIDTFYNIILSSTNELDTVFNNRGLGNAFSVIRSGSATSRFGFHISPTGSVAINTTLSDAGTKNTNGTALYVNGKSWLRSLKLGDGSAVSGYYLRTDAEGNIRFSTIDLNTQFSGIYPMGITYTNQGVDGSFRVDIGMRNTKLDGTNLGADDDGTIVAWRGDAWIDAKGFRTLQNLTNNDLRTLPGIQFGYKSLVSQTRQNHVFAGGSFKDTDDRYVGSSQYGQYYLRTRTTDGRQVQPLVTNWTKNSVVTTETINNCINLYPFSVSTNYEYDRVWTYKIEASVLWQNSTSGNPNLTSERFGGAYVIEGALIRTVSGIKFTKLGTENSNYYGENMPIGMGLSVQINTGDNIPRLSLVASGAQGYTAMWSATAKVNQLNHPGADSLYGN